MAPQQVALPVGNYRAGRRTRVRILTLHTTEGARTMESLAAFQRRMGNSSYHAGSDDDKIGFMVNRKHEAWHCRNGNPMMDGFVMCAFARWSRAEWLDHPVMLENAAWWLASCARERGVPLRHLTIAEARNAVRNRDHAGGVIAHWDYTRALSDGSHWDCGSNFPWTDVLTRARAIQQGGPAPAPKPLPPDLGGTVIPLSLDPTPTPTDWDDSTTWPRREIVVALGHIGGWRGRLWLRFSVMHPGGRLFRAHVDYPDGDKVRFAGWPDAGGDTDWPGIWCPPPYQAKRQNAFNPPAGPGTLMLTYAAPGGASLNLEWEK